MGGDRDRQRASTTGRRSGAAASSSGPSTGWRPRPWSPGRLASRRTSSGCSSWSRSAGAPSSTRVRCWCCSRTGRAARGLLAGEARAGVAGVNLALDGTLAGGVLANGSGRAGGEPGRSSGARPGADRGRRDHGARRTARLPRPRSRSARRARPRAGVDGVRRRRRAPADLLRRQRGHCDRHGAVGRGRATAAFHQRLRSRAQTLGARAARRDAPGARRPEADAPGRPAGTGASKRSKAAIGQTVEQLQLSIGGSRT